MHYLHVPWTLVSKNRLTVYRSKIIGLRTSSYWWQSLPPSSPSFKCNVSIRLIYFWWIPLTSTMSHDIHFWWWFFFLSVLRTIKLVAILTYVTILIKFELWNSSLPVFSIRSEVLLQREEGKLLTTENIYQLNYYHKQFIYIPWICHTLFSVAYLTLCSQNTILNIWVFFHNEIHMLVLLFTFEYFLIIEVSNQFW